MVGVVVVDGNDRDASFSLDRGSLVAVLISFALAKLAAFAAAAWVPRDKALLVVKTVAVGKTVAVVVVVAVLAPAPAPAPVPVPVVLLCT